MQTVWLFDLDNTLHNADAGIFQIINRAMTAHLAQHFGLPLEAASALREDYWHRYGATLAGLQIHHPETDIHDFLVHSHPMAEILANLTPLAGTEATLGRLKGRKAVFSNGPSFYVAALVEALGIAPHFERLFGTDDVALCYKPNRQAYLTVCQQINTLPQNCIMVDDSAANLEAAKALGMRTVWFGAEGKGADFVDCTAPDMAALADWAAAQGLLQTAA